MKHLTKRSFDVYAPGTKDSKPRFIKTIEVELENRFDEEFITQKSRREIERIRTRHLGLMSGEDIKALRKRLNLKQQELTDLLDCGDKTLSRWENGHGFPTGANNKLLRLLNEGFLAPASLQAIDSPLPETPWVEEVRLSAAPRRKPLLYFQTDEACSSYEHISPEEISKPELAYS
jgi:DNA-binding transcriptional regulator YiaG